MFRVQQKYSGRAGEIRYSEAPPHARFENRTRRIALKYVAQGAELYHYRKQVVSVKAGHFILLPTDEDFKVRTPKQDQHTRGLCIDLSLDTALESTLKDLETSFWSAWALAPLPLSPIHQNLNRGILSQASQPQHYWERDLLPQIREDLVLLAQNLIDLRDKISPRAKKISTQKHLIECLCQAQVYLQRHYRGKILQKNLAQHAQLSPDHLGYWYKRAFGLSLGEMQKKLRMEEAQRLLPKESWSLSDIAFHLGYTDLPAFSRQFKQYFQASPSEVRKSFGL